MPIAVERTVQAIGAVVQTVPVGTNIALLHLLWVMLNGSFLRSRGAVFGALDGQKFTRQEVRRSWAALRSGKWEVNELWTTGNCTWRVKTIGVCAGMKGIKLWAWISRGSGGRGWRALLSCRSHCASVCCTHGHQLHGAAQSAAGLPESKDHCGTI